MSSKRWWLRAAAALFAFSLLAAACGDDDEGATGSSTTVESGSSTTAAGPTTTLPPCEPQTYVETAGEAGEPAEPPADGGTEFTDLGTIVGDPPEHIDPALNVTLDAYQIVNALGDGLTDVNADDPDNVTIEPQVAESWESNEDASVWTFQIKEGLTFSDGSPILPTSFQNAWERASHRDFAGDYSYLFNFIQGGAEKLACEADTLAGVVADDEAMTLEVTLSAPYANFPAVAGFQLFFPMPPGAFEGDPNDWENGLMIGNGPYMMAEPRTDEQIVVVKNENWAGDINGDTWDDRIDKITFVTSADPDTAYNAFEAGEGDNANIPPGRAQDAIDNWGTTTDVLVAGTYHWEVKWDDPVIGGPENKLLRQAISQAINREEINTAVYDGIRTTLSGIVPPGIPGYIEGQCDYCLYDQAAAQEAFDAWKAEGNELTEPIRFQFNADAGHEPVVAIFIDNLAQIGIEAEAEPFPTETYFTELSDGACQICRSGWYADYPAYDNYLYDLFHTDSIGGNNHGFYSNPDYDALVDEGKAELDPAAQAEIFQEAERILLNDDIGVMPILGQKGDYAFNDEKVDDLHQNSFGLISWERITIIE